MIEVLNYKEKQQKHEFPSKLEKKMFKKFDYILILIVRTLKGSRVMRTELAIMTGLVQAPYSLILVMLI